jgi:hypothetical protein
MVQPFCHFQIITSTPKQALRPKKRLLQSSINLQIIQSTSSERYKSSTFDDHLFRSSKALHQESVIQIVTQTFLRMVCRKSLVTSIFLADV